MKKLDMIGKACPIPVIEAKKCLVNMAIGESLEVTVDNQAAVDNLKKLAAQRGDGISSETLSPTEFKVIFEVQSESADIAPENEMDFSCDVGGRNHRIVIFSSDMMGVGDRALGETLIKGFIYALNEVVPLPDVILFYNSGVKLALKDSPALADLKALEEKGVDIMVCGTCLNFYELTDQLGIGTIVNMYSIVEQCTLATHIIKP
ncbi:MAG TPA: sulfurtransferase-like selenium metabolism protein YedF [Clostridiaceae bacterium]|nr:sulfurtransferase-like selenium metabolism protein YedF [Clostridiaceae bacterium]